MDSFLSKEQSLLDPVGQEVALHGMSLFWSQWSEGSAFYNKETVQALKCSWNANVVRLAMGVEEGGYLTNPSAEQGRAEAVIQAAIDLGIYVIVDWHDHNAQNHPDQAVAFFSAISKKYGSNPNIIYEVFNEPLQVDWNNVLKPYHQKVVAAIRANDAKNIIILGTPTWSQDVDVAANSPVSGTNLMYTLHYYAATHKQSLRDKAQAALNKGIAIFVTEYGTVDASGGGSVDTTSSNEWYTFLDNNKISYANWAIDNKAEAAAALLPGTTSSQVGDDSRLTASGKLVKNKLKSQNNGVSCSGTSNPGVTTTTTTTQAPSNGGGSSSSGLTVSVSTSNSWIGGGEYKLVFKNTGTSAICGVNFNIVLGSGYKLENSWNLSPVSGTQYVLPSWINIQPGATYQDSGFVISGGNAIPPTSIVSIKKC
ncbi:Endoglucanase [Aphelenchoides bicaudatus]|nr:Endoglucanase [Aphelenchoides bicaudatus]